MRGADAVARITALMDATEAQARFGCRCEVIMRQIIAFENVPNMLQHSFVSLKNSRKLRRVEKKQLFYSRLHQRGGIYDPNSFLLKRLNMLSLFSHAY